VPVSRLFSCTMFCQAALVVKVTLVGWITLIRGLVVLFLPPDAEGGSS
jgi:hypothetical protein